MSAPLRDWLLREGLLPEPVLMAAAARQLVYGGTLDTALLETGAMTEAALWTRLSAATGLPVPAPSLCDGPLDGLPEASSPSWTFWSAERTAGLRAVPVAAQGGTEGGGIPHAATKTAGTITFLCAEPIAERELRAAAAEIGLQARLYVVPEVRLLAARQRVYGESVPGRYAPLLARVLGSARVRPQRRATATFPTPSPPVLPTAPTLPTAFQYESLLDLGDEAPRSPLAPTPLEHVLGASGTGALRATPEVEVDIEAGAQPTIPMLDLPEGPVRLELISEVSLAPRPGTPANDAAVPDEGEAKPDEVVDAPTEALCRRARDPGDKGRILALRALRRRLDAPVVANLLDELRATTAIGEASAAVRAIEALAELRDSGAVPALIGRLDGPSRAAPALADAIHATLVVLTAQDLGRSRRRWRAWAARHADRPRAEWLLEGLGHKSPAIRMAAAEDLRLISGDSYGYLFDMPKREREAARRRWLAWWTGHQERHAQAHAHAQKSDQENGQENGQDGAQSVGQPPTLATEPAHSPLGPSSPSPSHSPPPPPFPLPPAPKPR